MHIHDVVHSTDGFDFEVLTSSRSRSRVEDLDGDVKVIRAPEYARPTSTPITPAWAGHMRHTDADVIHFHMPNPFGELALLASRTQVPVVVTYHADIVGRRGVLHLYLPFQQRALRNACRIVVSSPLMLRAERIRPHVDRAVVIPFGVDPAAWRTRPAGADALRERYGPKVVLFLGRLAFYKGIHVLVEAMREVDARLLIVGSGPKEAELKQTATSHGVADRVVFVGEIGDEERAAYYHAADVFALPGTMRGEAFGIAMLEAMASGTPVVSTELGTGTSWVNVDGETGLVVPPKNVGALGAALRGLLDDPSRARELGEAGARRIKACFSKPSMIESMTSLYRSCGR